MMESLESTLTGRSGVNMARRLKQCSSSFIAVSCILLALSCTAGPTLSAPAAPVPKAAELSKLIEQAQIFPPGQRVLSRINEHEAVVSTYKSANSKDVVNDCKIDSMLIAKTVFSKYQDSIVRVKVMFHDPAQLKYVDTVSVTIGDVAAFASGKTSISTLLASLELRREFEKLPAALSGQSTKPGAGRSPQQAIVTLSSVGTTDDLVGYIQRESGLRFSYPKGWSLVEKPEPGALVSFSTGDENGLASITVSSDANASGSSLEQYVRLVEEAYLRPLFDCKVTSTVPVKFGKDNAIHGLCQSMMLTINNAKMKCEIYYFIFGNKIFNVRCVATEGIMSKMKPLFNSMLLTIAPVARTSSTAGYNSAPKSSADASKKDDTLSELYRGSDGHLSFNYPANWTEKPNVDASTIVKISGVNSKYQPCDITLNTTDYGGQNMVEHHANAVEEIWTGAAKNYKRLSRDHVSVGKSRDIDALKDSCTFEFGKVRCIMHVAYFFRDGKVQNLSVYCPGWDLAESRAFFDKILASAYFTR